MYTSINLELSQSRKITEYKNNSRYKVLRNYSNYSRGEALGQNSGTQDTVKVNPAVGQ